MEELVFRLFAIFALAGIAWQLQAIWDLLDAIRAIEQVRIERDINEWVREANLRDGQAAFAQGEATREIGSEQK